MIRADSGVISTLKFINTADYNLQSNTITTALTDLAARQLEEYFWGKRRCFDLPLRPCGTAFQQTVWNVLLSVPYGETRSYKQIAELTGNPRACRAVGMANNKNPLHIIIPCHRVVGSNGALIGYAGGLEIKERLLKLEKCFK
ncbi:MAG: methylated-DNA--[protein]-cysteine S-methyltransferase [Oscillospiraceae bacterium]|nr:methylated-DNA--[protein]-cysteine S-methyltransferase [Oscillospiraceae bacterium]